MEQTEKSGIDTRSRILDATEQLMCDEGYAGVSSRKVAVAAGLKSKLLHYYFRTMDDLFIAVFQRLEDNHGARFARAVASERPLHALWDIAMDAASGKLVLEFNALANHRPRVREIIDRSNSRDRRNMTAALSELFAKNGLDEQTYPPGVMALVMAGIARVLATERVLGSDEGHDEAHRYFQAFLGRLEPEAPAPEKAARKRRPGKPLAVA